MNALRPNPYHPDIEDNLSQELIDSTPFAGRKEAFGRLYQQLNDIAPGAMRALCFIGRRHVGKTALLLAFDTAFGENYAGARVFVSQFMPEDEEEFLLMLAQAATEAILDSTGKVGKLNEITQLEEDGDARAWLVETFMPVALSALQGRRLVFLIDDADKLLNAVRSGTLRMDTFAYLRLLVETFPEVGFVLTLDAEYEPEIDSLGPLIGVNDSCRLTNLAPDETRWLLQEPVRGCYTVPDDVALAVHKATGGAPALVQQFGYQLYQRWRLTPEINVITLEDVKALSRNLYQYAESAMKYDWLRLSPNEKRVLAAISQRYYADPLKRVDPEAIEAWLADSDKPMDRTAISAALRGLEYAELVQNSNTGTTITSGLMQAWLLENAGRMSFSGGAAIPARVTSLIAGETPAPKRGIPARLALMSVVAAAALGILAGVLVFGSPPTGEVQSPAPTVTLVNTPTALP